MYLSGSRRKIYRKEDCFQQNRQTRKSQTQQQQQKLPRIHPLNSYFLLCSIFFSQLHETPRREKWTKQIVRKQWSEVFHYGGFAQEQIVYRVTEIWSENQLSETSKQWLYFLCNSLG